MASARSGILTALVLAASGIAVAPTASAVCYSADCVPNVARHVTGGAPCKPGKYFNYGLGRNGETFVCNKIGVWTPAGPLIGIYNVALPCPEPNVSAQGSDGVAFFCAEMGSELRWVHRIDTLE